LITQLVLRHFKKISEETFRFTDFDLLVGGNNSGKSTILQALAIWQFCIDEFRRRKRSGKSGIQVVLPNFSALPVPVFNLLWKERTERKYPIGKSGKKQQEYILIEIEITWLSPNQKERTFGVQLRYQSPQAIYAIPRPGWKEFKELDKEQALPIIAYVPPFSGLEPEEQWRDISVIRKQVGKAQPGSVLRNLLLLIKSHESASDDWKEIHEMIRQWFSITLEEPKYEKGVDTFIKCEYVEGKKSYDLIAGGSGFHQTLTLLAFLYGYKPTTILLDEPDAHLHVNLQRQILDFFQKKSKENEIQFLIATHAEELVKGVDENRVVSLLEAKPTRNRPVPHLLDAMAEVSNQDQTQLRTSPYILYVEGESDERLLRAWAQILRQVSTLKDFCFHHMGGGSKKEMKDKASRHYKAVHEIIAEVKQLVVFDFDEEESFHPEPDNPALFEWSRKNIENYLLIPEAWHIAVIVQLKMKDDLLAAPVREFIDQFFQSQNLTLPKGQNWKNVSIDVFKTVNGKKLLFTGEDSLSNKLKKKFPNANITPEDVALSMQESQIHTDIENLFAKLKSVVS
jgi:predicted ATPase